MKAVVNFVISDTFASHLPENKAMGGTRIDLGTNLAYDCGSIKKAVELANKLIHLTTGKRETVFNYSRIRWEVRNGMRRHSWSNDNKTHHVELLFDGRWTEYTDSIRKGVTP